MQGELVGRLMEGKLLNKDFKGISVAGCHGKTTTTAMIATIFAESKLDPSYAVGTSSINPIGLPGHFGNGKYFIAEADEYATEPVFNKFPKFLWQQPDIAVITNIEFDHPDIYPNIDAVRTAYAIFAYNIKPNGLLVANGDDEEIKKILPYYKGRLITYGLHPDNDYLIQKIKISDGQTIFRAASRNFDLGDLVLNVLGEHNALNAASAAIAAHEAGIRLEDIKKGLFLFKGTRRRTEFVGKTSKGALIYDDYAHHPTEISKTLSALRSQFPNKKILSIFQPHTYSRTKLLFDQFSNAFNSTDMVIITDIFASAREQKDDSVSAEKLARMIAGHGKGAIYLPNQADVIQYVNEKKPGSETVIIIMGAGDIYKIIDKLLLPTIVDRR